MNRSRMVYYLGFPLVTFLLCGFSYYLGWTRGKQALRGITEAQVAPIPSTSPEAHEVAEELTFFRTLREPEDTAAHAVKGPAGERPAKAGTRLPKDLEEAEGTASPAGKGGTIAIQVSAFRDIGRAHELISELKNRGFPAFTPKQSRNKDSWYRVFVGPFHDREQANSISEELQQKGFSKGFLTNLGSGAE